MSLKNFNKAILKIEKDDISVVEVDLSLSELRVSLAARKEASFVGREISSALQTLQEEGVQTDQFTEHIDNFYTTAIKYFDNWCKMFEFTAKFQWTRLHEIPTWDQVSSCYGTVDKFVSVDVDGKRLNEDELFDEITNVNAYCATKLDEWNELQLSSSKRWVNVFQHFEKEHVSCENVKLLIEFIHSMPGSNSTVERLFSVMNSFWTKEKSSMKVETVKAVLILKSNINDTCAQFHDRLLKNTDLLRKIHSSEKYN